MGLRENSAAAYKETYAFLKCAASFNKMKLLLEREVI